MYARAFLEGRLSETQLANYRQEVAGGGLCSYPHPWLMPDFWQFPTGSMGIGQGLSRFGGHAPAQAPAQVCLLGCGAIFREVIAAAELLAQDWNIASDIFSATSFSELARDAAVTVAATGYLRAYPQLIAPFVHGRFVTLGTDGFGRSDTCAVLRRFFEVALHSIVVAALSALADEGKLERAMVAAAIKRYGISADAGASWTR